MREKKISILIPCRLSSRRLSKKALRYVTEQKTLIELVYSNTLKAIKELKQEEFQIWVCTDSKDIELLLKSKSIPCLMTKDSHKNGTERIAECLERYNINSEFIVDVQGDEPFVSSQMIGLVVDNLRKFSAKYKDESIVIIPHQIINYDEALRESTVKIVTTDKQRVLYLSRYPIPYFHKKNEFKIFEYKKHLSVIGFNRKALLKFSNHRLEEIEKVEDIELIRSLNNGSLIFSPFSETTSFSIDTIEDLEKAKRILRGE